MRKNGHNNADHFVEPQEVSHMYTHSSQKQQKSQHQDHFNGPILTRNYTCYRQVGQETLSGGQEGRLMTKRLSVQIQVLDTRCYLLYLKRGRGWPILKQLLYWWESHISCERLSIEFVDGISSYRLFHFEKGILWQIWNLNLAFYWQHWRETRMCTIQQQVFHSKSCSKVFLSLNFYSV